MFIKENKYDETYGGTEPKMFGRFHIRELHYKYAYPAYKKEQLKGATMRTSYIIEMMGFWEMYLDNPEELE